MTQTVVYVSCAESREIDVFFLNQQTGGLQLRQRFGVAGAPHPLKIGPKQRVLYAGTRAENALLALGIDSRSGELALRGTLPTSGAPTYVACDQQAQVAFSASYGDNSLSVIALDAQGEPSAVTQYEPELPRAHAALMDATNRWLLVPMLGADAIRVYALGADGRIAPHASVMLSVRPGSGPRHLVFSPDNRHVHCLNELDGSIDLFDFDAEAGTLALQQSISMLPEGFAGKPWAAELRATPDGRFLYATDRTASVISAFAVAEHTGHMTLIAHYATEAQPRGMAIDPSGRWLIAAGQLSAHVSVYAIDTSNGRLAPTQRHSTGLDPICVEVLTLPPAQE